jgi:hypothetical protein
MAYANMVNAASWHRSSSGARSSNSVGVGSTKVADVLPIFGLPMLRMIIPRCAGNTLHSVAFACRGITAGHYREVAAAASRPDARPMSHLTSARG